MGCGQSHAELEEKVLYLSNTPFVLHFTEEQLEVRNCLLAVEKPFLLRDTGALLHPFECFITASSEFASHTRTTHAFLLVSRVCLCRP